MELLHAHCAGLDVHKATVVACVRHHMPDGTAKREVRTFATTTQGLLELAEWLSSEGCTCVGMEATGVYWKPVWHILSGGDFELILANAQHVKNVPGRKTDVIDAAWLADLVAHGLMRASFVPDGETQVMRSLLRTRKQLVRERTSHVQRIQKTLEEANVKLDSVISDVLGVSGRKMLRAMIAGETDPAKLAALAGPGIKAVPAELREALRGRIMPHHRFLLDEHLHHIEQLDAFVERIDQQVEARIAPFCAAVEQVSSIPGIAELSARGIIAETGIDMSRFPTERNFVAWIGYCPRNDESAGKRRSNRMRKGAPWLRTILNQCAKAASRSKGTYFEALFHRIRARRGTKKAIGAVAASLATTIYHMLKDGTFYQDLGPDHFTKRNKTAHTKRLVTRLQSLGYDVQISPLPAQ
jgi:transposase